MYKGKKITCVIPARLASQRFPEKMLATLAQRPLLAWVWDAAKKVSLFDDVVFAVDDEKIAAVIHRFGGNVLMTSPECASGTDRLVELFISKKITGDVFVNWQGDEPFILPDMISTLLQTIDIPGQEIWTLRTRIHNPADISARNIAKVVCDQKNRALCFSRSPIPCVRDAQDSAGAFAQTSYYKHVGLYAFTGNALASIATMHESFLESAEKLEMLRWLDNGISVYVHETQREVFGIDTTSDLEKAELYVQSGFKVSDVYQ